MPKHQASRPIKPNEFILITGCSSGIGLATACLLHEQGYRVIASCRHAKDLPRIAAYGFFHCLALDLADSRCIEQAWKTLMNLTDNRLFALFNNGAFGLPGALEDISREALEYQFNTNVFGTHQLTQLAVKHMLEQGYGRILHNSSVLGYTAMSLRGSYNASKFALEGLAATQRLELFSDPVDIILLQPGPIMSQFRQNAFKHYQHWVSQKPSRYEHIYQHMIARLTAETATAPFTLPAEVVAQVVLKALQTKQPKIQYRITLPSKVFYLLRRLLPAGWLDRILILVSGGGKR